MICFSELSKSELMYEYELLISRFVPIESKNGFFNFSKPVDHSYHQYGWKFHISATILNANRTLSEVAPFLTKNELLFKVPKKIENLIRLNTGSDSDYRQIGKFITVYPNTNNSKKLKHIASQLHLLTCANLDAPQVPFEERFCQDSRIYYRYGSYFLKSINEESSWEAVIDDYYDDTLPVGVNNPFSKLEVKPSSHLLKKYPVIEVISQRGKGGTYLALDVTSESPTTCIVKEGRKNGEVNWHGQDGIFYRICEYNYLKKLALIGVKVPHIIDFIESDQAVFLILQNHGTPLDQVFRNRKIGRTEKSNILKMIAQELSKMHAHNCYWLDCKLSNILLNNNGDITLIDFEMDPEADPLAQEQYIFSTYQHLAISPKNIDIYTFLATCFEVIHEMTLPKVGLQQTHLDNIERGDNEELFIAWLSIVQGSSPILSIEEIIEML
jgi:hypothetical protein